MEMVSLMLELFGLHDRIKEFSGLAVQLIIEWNDSRLGNHL